MRDTIVEALIDVTEVESIRCERRIDQLNWIVELSKGDEIRVTYEAALDIYDKLQDHLKRVFKVESEPQSLEELFE